MLVVTTDKIGVEGLIQRELAAASRSERVHLRCTNSVADVVHLTWIVCSLMVAREQMTTLRSKGFTIYVWCN